MNFAKKKIFKCLIIIFLILLSVIVGIRFTIFPDLEPDFNEYGFYIGMVEMEPILKNQDSNIQNYLLKYDFKKNKGQLSFDFWTNLNNVTLYAEFPSQLIIENYSVFDKETMNIFECSLVDESHEISCGFDNFPDNHVSFKLNITSPKKDFIPNGLFYFGQDLKRIFLFNDVEYSKRDILLIFKFGKKYKCDKDCFVKEIGNKGLSYYLIGEEFGVYLLPNSEEKLGFTRFRLNTYSYAKKIRKGVFLTFFISLLASLLVVLLERILCNNKKRNQKNHIQTKLKFHLP